jgi:hypothetical protein
MIHNTFFSKSFLALFLVAFAFFTGCQDKNEDPSATAPPVNPPGNNTGSPFVVTTYAGSSKGFLDGNATTAKFNGLTSVVSDKDGIVFVVDNKNHSIRKITPDGIVTTIAGDGFAGSKDGIGNNANFNSPVGIALGKDGNLYVADNQNHSIRQITPDGIVSTFAGTGAPGYKDGAAKEAQFKNPMGIAIAADGTIYISEYKNLRIRKISPVGTVSTLAGSGEIGKADGTGIAASFNGPTGLSVGPSGNIYVADESNHLIRKITPAGEVTTIAGSIKGFKDGKGPAAAFENPFSLVVDANENIFIADAYNHAIRAIDVSKDEVTTMAGGSFFGYKDADGEKALFSSPLGLTINPDGQLLIADTGNSVVRKIKKK